MTRGRPQIYFTKEKEIEMHNMGTLESMKRHPFFCNCQMFYTSKYQHSKNLLLTQ